LTSHAAGDLRRGGNAQRTHAVGQCRGGQFLQVQGRLDHLPQCRRDAHHLVDAGAAEEAGIAAFQTPGRRIHACGERQVPALRECRPAVHVERRVGLAMRAQRAHEALGNDAGEGRLDQVVRRAEVEQARDCRGRVVRVQRRQHEVPG
jgi:hypothetical protein